MALSYLAEIDSSLLEKAEFINILSSHEFLFDPHDLQRGQKLLLEEMGRIMNLVEDTLLGVDTIVGSPHRL